MKVSRTTAAANRAALLEQGGRLFRRHGIDGVSLSEVARQAGLTHGAFYGHFASKTALVAEAVGTSMILSARRWAKLAAWRRSEGDEGLAALIASYLREVHRDTPAVGCALAALGPEMSRAEPALADALQKGTAVLVSVLAGEIGFLHPELSAAAGRARALAVLSAMTGGLVLARALAGDGEASRAALESAAVVARAAADIVSPSG